MTVGVARLGFYLEGTTSLKDKRAIVRPVVDRVRDRFNVGIAGGNAIEQYKRAYRRRAAKAAERDDRLARSADDAGLEVAGREAGNAAQQVGNRLGRGTGDLGLSEDDHLYRKRSQRLLGAGGRDDDGVELPRTCRVELFLRRTGRRH